MGGLAAVRVVPVVRASGALLAEIDVAVVAAASSQPVMADVVEDIVWLVVAMPLVGTLVVDCMWVFMVEFIVKYENGAGSSPLACGRRSENADPSEETAAVSTEYFWCSQNQNC
jgi:hypothetical protein